MLAGWPRFRRRGRGGGLRRSRPKDRAEVMSGHVNMNSEELLRLKLKQMRLNLRKFIYQDLLKHCDPEDAKSMASKREEKIYSSCNNSYSAYEQRYQEYLAENPNHAPKSTKQVPPNGIRGGPAYSSVSGAAGGSLADVVRNSNYASSRGDFDKLRNYITKYASWCPPARPRSPPQYVGQHQGCPMNDHCRAV